MNVIEWNIMILLVCEGMPRSNFTILQKHLENVETFLENMNAASENY